MHTVNLLPWRDWQRQRAARRFKAWTLASLLLGGTCVLLLDLHLRAATRTAQLDSAALQADFYRFDQRLAEVTALDARRATLTAQLTAIEALRAGRQPLGQWLRELGQRLPPGVQLTEVQVQSGTLRVAGVAESGAQVARLLEGLAQLPRLAAPSVQQIKAAAQGEQFLLSAQVIP